MLRGPVTVSTDAYEATRQRYGFEEQHYVLAVPIPDVSLQEFPAWERRAFDELGRIGLANGASVHQDLLDTMQLLAKPPIELHGRIGYHNKATIGFVAASDGRSAVLAVRDDSALHLRPIAPDKLAAAAVGLLPQAPAGKGQSITMSMDTANRLTSGAAASRQEDDQNWLQSSGDHVDTDGRTLQRLLAEPRFGGGRIYAGRRDAMGHRRKSKQPMTYMDLESGRWLFRQKPNASGQLWMVIQPASQETLTANANELLRELQS
ncbi:MAG: ESX secretion-associated protein EspG [Kutzneria sp.]|nr:ESX secretion-associated protein EspG [Kutzneria sp.]MBV9844897.1 ESX secretion-associated protein EspG [Kutzneria sp.]